MARIARFEFDGADGATTATDSSGVGTKTFTFSGAAALRTAQSVSGGSSLRTTGALGSYLTVTSTSEMNVGSGDFALHLWVYRDNLGSGQCVMSNGTSAGLYLTSTNGTGAVRWNTQVVVNCPDLICPAGEWHAFGLSRKSGIISVFLDGVRAHRVENTASINLSNLCFGRLDYYNNSFFPGYIDGVIVDNAALWTEGYDPFDLTARDGVFPTFSSAASATEAFAQRWPATMQFDSPLIFGKDTEYGGDGRIAGTTKIKGSPDYPTRVRVRLFRDVDGVCIRETWSDAETGEYEFAYIDAAQRYTVVCYDHTRAFRAVIADNLLPEAM